MRSHFPIVELGKHVRQVSQRNRAEAAIEVFSVTNSEGFTRSTDYFSKEVFSKDVSNYKVVRPGQFAYNPSRINVGSIDYLRHNSPVLVSPLYVVFEGDEELQADFLLRYLKSNWGNAQIRSNTEGAVRDSLKFKGLESIKIPLPPLNDQIRIAHLLGKVEGLIAQRKQHLQQLDDLLKSVFLEMFGDPVRNEKKWETKKLPELIAPSKHSLKRGPFGGSLKKEIFVPEGYLIYEQNHALNGDYSFGRYFVGEDKFNELIDFQVKPGDILISCSGVYLGKLSIVPNGAQTGIINQALLKVTLNVNVMRQIFFVYLFGNQQFKDKNIPTDRGGAIPNLPPMSVIKNIDFITPPIEIQNKFVAVVEKIEAIKTQYQHSLSELEALYGALSQKAFNGELDLSRVLLNMKNKDYEEVEP